MHILTLEHRMAGYHDFHEKIAPRSPVYARLPLVADADALSIVNTGRN